MASISFHYFARFYIIASADQSSLFYYIHISSELNMILQKIAALIKKPFFQFKLQYSFGVGNSDQNQKTKSPAIEMVNNISWSFVEFLQMNKMYFEGFTKFNYCQQTIFKQLERQIHAWKEFQDYKFQKMNLKTAEFKLIRSQCFYKGQLLDGKPHGFGVQNTNDGSNYQGQFKNGLRHGYGKETTQDLHYFGQFHENVKQGQGIQFKDSPFTRYLGSWKNGKKNGLGQQEQIYHGGIYQTFQGYYQENKRNGLGILFKYYDSGEGVSKLLELWQNDQKKEELVSIYPFQCQCKQYAEDQSHWEEQTIKKLLKQYPHLRDQAIYLNRNTDFGQYFLAELIKKYNEEDTKIKTI